MNFLKSNRISAFTLLELIIVVVIIATLAVVAIPIVETSIKRGKEIELRRNLRIIRTAIDDYRKFVIEKKIEVDEDRYGYPKKLLDLVEGIEYRDKNNQSRIQKFLRKIPIDPITNSYDWGLRSYQDKRKASYWGGQNIWDVYSKSEKMALNGSNYKDW